MSPLDAARALLPAWVVWGPLLYVPLAFLAALAGSSAAFVAGSWPWPGRSEHWTERARCYYPGRVLASRGAVVMPLVWATAAFQLGSVMRASRWAVALAAAAASFMGSALVSWLAERVVRQRRLALSDWLITLVSVCLILLPTPFVVVALIGVMPARMGPRAAGVLLVGAVVFVLLLRGGALSVARRVGLARPAGPRLAEAVDTGGRRAFLRPRSVHELRMSAALAAAFPFSNSLVFSMPAVEMLENDELAAVAAHEIAHLAEPTSAALARAVGTLSLLPLAAVPALLGSFGLESLPAVLVVVLGTNLLVRPIARRLETDADRAAGADEGHACALARGLARLYEYNLTPAVLHRRAGHPDLYDRLIEAGATPDYPRPRPPGAGRGLLATLALAAPLALLVTSLPEWVSMQGDREQRLLWSIALTGGGSRELTALAFVYQRRGAEEAAATLNRAALVLDDAAEDDRDP